MESLEPPENNPLDDIALILIGLTLISIGLIELLS